MQENRTITSVPGVRVGNRTDAEAATGCTVVLPPSHGAVAGVEVRGAAPGTRETDLLRPGTLVERVHAILLTGGSAFGLAAADGVMSHLEAEGVGFPTASGPVPIVPAAVIFDLGIGNAAQRPGRDDGYAAAGDARDAPAPSGSIGAGAGATVAKILGMDRAIKGGLGSAVRQLVSGYSVGALMVVNAVGDILDPATGVTLAGPRRRQDGIGFENAREILWNEQRSRPAFRESTTNTTLGVIATDAPLSVSQANRIAVMAHSGIARAIVPSYGMGDGDTLFVMSTAPPDAPPIEAFGLTGLGSAAADAVERAIVDAIQSATGLAGVPSAAEYLAGRGEEA